MTYSVIIQPSAQLDLEKALRWLRKRSPAQARRWYERLVRAVYSLENHPARCGLAPESEAFREEIRQLLFGKRGGIYRILFTIHQNEVSILHIRHSAQQFLEPDSSSEEQDD